MADLLAERINLGNGARIRGGLLEAAYPLPEGWENGVTFLGTGCSEPQETTICVVTDRTETRPEGATIQEPVFIAQSAACSMLSKIGTVDIATNRLEATTEWALGRLLATGLGTDNVSFEDAESVSESGDPVDAVSCLEQGAANVGFGAEVFLHAPLRAAAYLKSNHLLSDDFRSPSGLQWILSPGYPTEDDSVTIWATGSVFADVTDAYDLTDPQTGRPPVGWRINTDAAFRQRLGLAAFDPCLLISATFTVPACSGGS